jgi:aspartate/tyrosine/aromatic aminotransferase
MAEKGTDLKGKRLSNPRWVVHKSIVNMKGMNVNLYRLRPVPIKDEQYPHTVNADLYSLVCHACIFTFCQAEGTNVILCCFYSFMII